MAGEVAERQRSRGFSRQARSGEPAIAAADLMLMPSELESFGLAALEAMACEVPTIGTNVGGVPE